MNNENEKKGLKNFLKNVIEVKVNAKYAYKLGLQTCRVEMKDKVDLKPKK